MLFIDTGTNDCYFISSAQQSGQSWNRTITLLHTRQASYHCITATLNILVIVMPLLYDVAAVDDANCDIDAGARAFDAETVATDVG